MNDKKDKASGKINIGLAVKALGFASMPALVATVALVFVTKDSFSQNKLFDAGANAEQNNRIVRLEVRDDFFDRAIHRNEKALQRIEQKLDKALAKMK